MKYGPLQNVIDIHVVTAGEAAYTGLFGLYLPHKNPIWLDTINMPIEEEEWLVEGMDCHVYDSTGLNYHGRLILLCAAHPPGQGPQLLPATRWQNLGTRVSLERPVHVIHGLCVLLRKGVVATNDQIQVSFGYRRVSYG